MFFNFLCILGVEVGGVEVIFNEVSSERRCGGDDLLLVKVFSCTGKGLEGMMILVTLESSKLLSKEGV